jgi:hypothetical protein
MRYVRSFLVCCSLALLLGSAALAQDAKHQPAGGFQLNLGSDFDWAAQFNAATPTTASSAFSFGNVDWSHLPGLGEKGGRRFDQTLFSELGRGPKLANDVAGFSTTLDVFLSRDFLSPGQSGVAASYGIGSYWMWKDAISPGFQAIGDLAQFSSNLPHYGEAQHRVGPALGGNLDLGLGPINWNLAYMFGLNSNTESGALKAGIDYQLPF